MKNSRIKSRRSKSSAVSLMKRRKKYSVRWLDAVEMVANGAAPITGGGTASTNAGQFPGFNPNDPSNLTPPPQPASSNPSSSGHYAGWAGLPDWPSIGPGNNSNNGPTSPDSGDSEPWDPPDPNTDIPGPINAPPGPGYPAQPEIPWWEAVLQILFPINNDPFGVGGGGGNDDEGDDYSPSSTLDDGSSDGSGDGSYSGSSYTYAKNDHVKKLNALPGDLLAKCLVTNLAGVWRFDSDKASITPNGAAVCGLTIASTQRDVATLGIVKWGPQNVAGLVTHVSRDGVKRATLLPLPKSSSYCFEFDIEQIRGQVTCWINDTGWDMGTLGFKGGALGMVSARVLHHGDHMLSGHFSDCAVAVGDKWQALDLTIHPPQNNLALYHEYEHPTPDSIHIRDLRTAMV